MQPKDVHNLFQKVLGTISYREGAMHMHLVPFGINLIQKQG